MMTTLFLALSLYLSPATTVNPACETVGPRLDGSMVEICNGSVTHVYMLGAMAPAGVSVVIFDAQEDDTFTAERE